MNHLELFHNKIIICPSSKKQQLLQEEGQSKSLYQITCLTKEELFEKSTFLYDGAAIFYLMKQYHLKVEVAIVLLSSMQLMSEVEDQDIKIKELKRMKQELMDHHLLTINPSFLSFLSTKQIIVYGYYELEKQYRNILNHLPSVTYFHPEIPLQNQFTCYEFETMEEEVVYVFHQISKLIKSGIDIGRIKLTGVSQEYHYLMASLAPLFHLPLTIPHLTSLYDLSVTHTFLQLIDDEEEAVKFLRSEKNPSLLLVKNKLIQIINYYPWRKHLEEIKDLLIYDFKHTFLDEEYQNDLKVVSFYKADFSESDYVFVLGFNQGNLPLIHQDEDYFSDSLKVKLGLDTSSDLNQMCKRETLSILGSIRNLTVTYKKHSSFAEHYPSTLLQESNFSLVKNPSFDLDASHQYNKLLLTGAIDQLIKYGTQSDKLSSLYSTYPSLPYRQYDNQFQGIDSQQIFESYSKGLRLSYTSMNQYYQCGFLYYVEQVLKLRLYEETFSLALGTLFHAILSVAFTPEFDFETSWQNGIIQCSYPLGKKEEVLLIKLKEQMKFILNTIQEQMGHILYDKALYEQEVVVTIEDCVSITFKGIIDKILYHESEDGENFVAIIDYKTGSVETGLENTWYGLNLQLPVYLYLSRRSNALKHVKLYGFYYQTILQNEVKADSEEEYLQMRKKYMKLQGYSLNDLSHKMRFDDSMEDSKVIQSMKLKKDGNYGAYAKVLGTDQMDALDRLVESKIRHAAQEISHGKFNINPKVIDGVNHSCRYCLYQDLCFVRPSNEMILSKVNGLSFLGGDINESMD